MGIEALKNFFRGPEGKPEQQMTPEAKAERVEAITKELQSLVQERDELSGRMSRLHRAGGRGYVLNKRIGDVGGRIQRLREELESLGGNESDADNAEGEP